MDLVINAVVKSAMRRRLIELLMEYFRGYQTECRRVQRLPPLPAFYPPAPSSIDGLIGMFEMRQQSLLSDSYKLGSFRALGRTRSSQAGILFPLMLFIEGPAPQLSFKRDLGWMQIKHCAKRERYQFDWWDHVGDAGEENDYEAIKDLPPALSPAAAIEISE
jgi:hypothetical protein